MSRSLYQLARIQKPIILSRPMTLHEENYTNLCRQFSELYSINTITAMQACPITVTQANSTTTVEAS